MTLERVAELSGVSRATASRALSGSARVNDDTRRRVLEAADSIGYRPNAAARSLASGRSKILGLVLPVSHLVADPYGSQMVSGVAAAASELGHQLMLWLTRDEPDDTVRDIFKNGIIDGLIVAAPALGNDWIEELIDGPLPTVLIGMHPRRNDVNVISVDNLGGSVAAVEHLVDLGHQRIATITGPLERRDATDRYGGYVSVLVEQGLPVEPTLVASGDYTPESGAAAMEVLLPHSPTAVFAANDSMARGAIRTIERSGLRVPEDISVVGFDGLVAGVSGELDLTTVHQSLEDVATRATDALVRIVAGEFDGPVVDLLDVDLVLGATAAAPAHLPP